MILLIVIVFDELGDRSTVIASAQQDDQIETFVLDDGAHKPFRVRVGVRCSPWRLDHANRRVAQLNAQCRALVFHDSADVCQTCR